MNERYPKIRIRSKSGSCLVREGLSFNFYLRHPHEVIAASVERSLEAYLRATGLQALGWYADEQGEFQKLDAAGWAQIRRALHAES
ncbi:MAG TPA: type VI immunity family protein, partial [Myxococcaceae bacterium]